MCPMSTPTDLTPPAPPIVVVKEGNYTVKEAADWARVSPQTIYAAIRDGHLTAKQLTPNARRSTYLITGAALFDWRENLPDAGA